MGEILAQSLELVCLATVHTGHAGGEKETEFEQVLSHCMFTTQGLLDGTDLIVCRV